MLTGHAPKLWSGKSYLGKKHTVNLEFNVRYRIESFDISKYRIFDLPSLEISVGIVSKVLTYRNIEVSIYRNIEVDIPKYRTCFALHPLASPCFLSSYWTKAAMYIPGIKYRNRTYRLLLVYRYRIELHSDNDIQHNYRGNGWLILRVHMYTYHEICPRKISCVYVYIYTYDILIVCPRKISLLRGWRILRVSIHIMKYVPGKSRSWGGDVSCVYVYLSWNMSPENLLRVCIQSHSMSPENLALKFLAGLFPLSFEQAGVKPFQ